MNAPFYVINCYSYGNIKNREGLILILLDEHQKIQFKRLSQLLMESESKYEINYYSDKIHKLLDEAEKLDKNVIEIFNEEQREEYILYKQLLLDAKTNEEISYYESKIMEIIDKNMPMPS